MPLGFVSACFHHGLVFQSVYHIQLGFSRKNTIFGGPLKKPGGANFFCVTLSFRCDFTFQEKAVISLFFSSRVLCLFAYIRQIRQSSPLCAGLLIVRFVALSNFLFLLLSFLLAFAAMGETNPKRLRRLLH